MDNIHRHLCAGGKAIVNFPNQSNHSINHFNEVDDVRALFAAFSRVRVSPRFNASDRVVCIYDNGAALGIPHRLASSFELTKKRRPVEIGNLDQKFGFVDHEFMSSSRDAMIRLRRIEVVHEEITSAHHARIKETEDF